MAAGFQEKARRLRNAVEPVAAGVYFAPEAHQAYQALGFEGSPVSQDGVARPELRSYFTSRGACLGQVPGEVVAAAFGVFNPKAVVPAVQAGGRSPAGGPSWRPGSGARRRCCSGFSEPTRGAWAGSPACCAAPRPRPRGQAARSSGDCARWAFPGHRLGELWRAADLLREYRGDSHVIAWAAGGAGAVEVLLLTEQWWGLPPRSYTPTRSAMSLEHAEGGP